MLGGRDPVGPVRPCSTTGPGWGVYAKTCCTPGILELCLRGTLVPATPSTGGIPCILPWPLGPVPS